MPGPMSLGSISLHRVTPHGNTGSAHGLSTPRADDWRDSAACRTGVDPETFFPFPGDATGTAKAKAICAGCPARTTCLAWAIKSGQDAGIWGGLTEQERRALKRRPKTTTRTTRTGGTTR